MTSYLYLILLGYLKHSNAAPHSVDCDIFYAVIRQPARSKTYIKLYFSKVMSHREEPVLVCINDEV